MESLLNSAKNGNTTSSDSFIKQAEQIWSMLDDMADTNADSYKYIMNKNM